MSLLARLALGLGAKPPLVLQSEVAECGLACLCMVAHYHGRPEELATLRRRHAVSAHGATLASLIDIAHRMGFTARALRLEPAELSGLQLPCVLHWEFRHFVVLKKLARHGAIVLDPARGERRLTAQELSDAFTGVALELWPSRRFERRKAEPPAKLREVIGRVRGAAGALARILALAFALEVFAIATPLALQWIIDDALLTANRDLLATLVLATAVLVLGRELASAGRSWLIMHFGTLLNLQWQTNTLAHLLELPHGYFQHRHLGDIVSRFRSIDVIERTLGTTFVEALLDGLMSVAIAAVLFFYSPWLTLVPLAAIALYALARLASFRRLRAAAEEQAMHAAKQDSHLIETIRGARTLKLFGRSHVRVAAWAGVVVEQINAGLRGRKLAIAHHAANGLLFGFENVLVIWIGASLVLDHDLTLGMLIAFLAYKAQLTTRLGAFLDELFELKALGVHVARVADIVLSEPERIDNAPRLALRDSDAPAHAIAGGARLEARGVAFRYSPHDGEVLKGIELDVGAGESVGIAGASGAGKTTLLLLLLGVLRPTEGEILIDGVSLATAGELATRSIASVTQDDTLFAGSIADNISCFDAAAEQSRIEQCARLAAIDRDIEAMPMAYNTLVGYLGGVLSGGQQQRVLLARALYKRPRLLILDEATSHLDLAREAQVTRQLRALGMTRIVVAHRPETLAAVDRTFELANGRLLETRRRPA